MFDRNESAHKGSSDQVVSMAMVVVGFAAHERDRACRPELDQPLDRLKVKWSSRKALIINLALAVVEFCSLRPAAQLAAHIHILNTNPFQRFSQHLLVELGRVAAERLAASVDDCVDTMLEQ